MGVGRNLAKQWKLFHQIPTNTQHTNKHYNENYVGT